MMERRTNPRPLVLAFRPRRAKEMYCQDFRQTGRTRESIQRADEMKDFAKLYLSFVFTSIVNPGEIIYSGEGALGFGDFSGIIIRNLS
jgi:hypothetical protein